MNENHLYLILFFISILSFSTIPTTSASNLNECNTNLCCCPFFDYTLKATTEVTELTRFEADLVVPAAPKDISTLTPQWGIFPFVEPSMDTNNPRYGIIQPVLEWNYKYKTHQWTITPWYEDANGNKHCNEQSNANNPNYCLCTKEQQSLGNQAIPNLYTTDVPQCHKICEPKHGQRITANSGDTIHFTITKTGNAWITTALNSKTNQKTSFQTTCIQPNDKLKIGFALEKQKQECTSIQNHNGESFPGNITFTNIKFTGNTNTIQLKPTIEPTAKTCFPWLDTQITNSWFGAGSTETVTLITQPNTMKSDL